jgi:hypothetical protein
MKIGGRRLEGERRRSRRFWATGVVAAVAALLSLPGIASAAPPSNDDYTNAQTLALFTVITTDTTDATTAAGEPVTPGNPGFCGGTSQMGNTVWYKVSAPAGGGQISVNTFGSGFDTLIVVYNTDGNPAPAFANALVCSDDAAAFSLGTSRLSFAAADGSDYLIQVGGFFDGATAASGFLRVIASDSPPPNDNRAAAQDVTAGAVLDNRDNVGATEETAAPAEDLSCPDPNERPLGSTVWFHYAASATGMATFTTTGLDTVMQVYRGSDAAPLKCNDDSPNQVGPSRVSLDVTPGDYYIQVGGFAGVQGGFSISTEFVENLDIDGDGSNRPADCNDGNAAIHPGATDVPENGVDEDCSGSDAVNLDHDGDTFNTPQDCNDGNAAVHPGAVDVPDNGVDEDCSGSDAVNLDHDGDGIPRPRDCNDENPAIRPGARDIPGDRIDQDCSGSDAKFAALKWRYGFFFTPAGRVTSLTVNVRRGARVKMSCKGSGCPGSKSLKSRGKMLKLSRFFRRPLGSGATIELRATLSGHIGRVARITFRKGKAPTKRELCLPPGKSRPTKCST